MPSLQARLMKFLMRKLRAQATSMLDDLQLLRIEKERTFSRMRPPHNIKYKHVEIQHVSGEWLIPDNIKYPHKVLLYLHGGGYASCSVHSHRGLIGKLAVETGMRALGINYRLAPEHPYPAALDDALLAYRWLLESEKYAPEDIVVMGDSAGGGLALCLLLQLRELGMQQPMGAVLLSPWTDLAGKGETMFTHADRDPLLPPDKIREWGSWYAGETDVHHPLISPVYATLENLAPMLIHVGTDEVLLSDSTRVAKNAQNAGTYVELDIWNGMPHVWHMGWRYIPEAAQAIRKIAAFTDALIEKTEREAGRNTANALVSSKSSGTGWKDSIAGAIEIGTGVLKGLFTGK